ncbi:hypothetical protein CY0110_19682 [Crocosphaera chwakensis CCY0110]|uniref:Uncharacterized protein n=1 Tax=Crocosphaera chwakensis CCY0110 TaxID=391612 RepID=A3IJR8_9CHRO|nr:hypothetical protein CY0110_19682 [Crocosphaera chwakensis CCY0110]
MRTSCLIQSVSFLLFLSSAIMVTFGAILSSFLI